QHCIALRTLRSLHRCVISSASAWQKDYAARIGSRRLGSVRMPRHVLTDQFIPGADDGGDRAAWRPQ
ncbi:MAG: hypothetical protein P3C10_09380, partial [Gemmatimonadota bacterium]|nr:hypothetical protein [Gemmatimonadota bacterium]